jgi:hypothetical protein
MNTFLRIVELLLAIAAITLCVSAAIWKAAELFLF